MLGIDITTMRKKTHRTDNVVQIRRGQIIVKTETFSYSSYFSEGNYYDGKKTEHNLYSTL